MEWRVGRIPNDAALDTYQRCLARCLPSCACAFVPSCRTRRTFASLAVAASRGHPRAPFRQGSPRLPVECASLAAEQIADRAALFLTGLPYTLEHRRSRALSFALGDERRRVRKVEYSVPSFFILPRSLSPFLVSISLSSSFLTPRAPPGLIPSPSPSARSVSVTQRYHCLSVVECRGDSVPFPGTAP